ncbi:MAG: S8 family serine peptidase, partial [Anaerolineales bacterium]
MADTTAGGVSTAKPLDKIHPDLRDLALSAAPALPSGYEQQAAAQEPVMVEVIAQVSEREDLDLSGFFVDGKFIQRRPLGKGEFKTQTFFGQVQASELLKLASIARVQVILPVVLEENGQPDDYPIDDQKQAAEQPGPEEWAALRAKADEMRAGSLPWSEAKAFGDGREQFTPQDWFEVAPMGPHKAETAWDRGYTGEGVAVAVNDDGVDHAHPDLMGTQKIYDSSAAPQYNGWPMVFSPVSMLLYSYDNTQGTSYIANGYYSIHYADTSATPALSYCGVGLSCFTFTPLIDYGQLGIEHSYTISSTMTKSGVVHVGTHPDNNLRDYVWGERPAVIVTDPNTAGVYDTVYMDLNDDYDFRDEKPLTKADVSDLPNTRNNMIGYRDMDGDGLADISGGKLYFIADGVNPIPVSDWLYGRDAPAPGNGDLIAVANGSLDGGYSHGTQCASNVAGQGVVDGLLPAFADLGDPGEAATPAGAVYGMAPGVDIVDVTNIYWNFASSKIDAYTFAAIGYGHTDTDAIQITSNSYGSSDQDNDGWDFDGQYVSQIMRVWAPQLQMTFSTGNGGPGFGTTSPPSPDVAIAVGASTEFDSTGWDSITHTHQIMYNDVIPFSNRGPGARGLNGVDVVAGGAYAAGDLSLNYGPPSTFGVVDGNLAWDTWGGTSRSSPVTAGVLALLYNAYKDTYGDWPDSETAKALLQSSATDLDYDSMTQGSGSVNADRGTLVASGEYGVFAMQSEWEPGDYRGMDYPGFAHLVLPGDTFNQTFDVYNPSDSAINVDIQSGATQLISTETISFTVTPEMFAAKNPDAFINSPTWIIPLTATADKMAANPWWDNIEIPSDTELMIVRMRYPYDQFDVGSDLSWDNRFRLMVYNWEDYNGDDEVWVDANGDNTVNVTTNGVVSQIDGYQGTDWSNTETQKWEFGRFGYNRPGGDVLEMWVQNPLERMLDGLFIGLQQYDASTVEETNMSFEIDFYKYQDVSWLSANTDNMDVPAHSSASFVGTVDVPADIPAGVYEAHFKLVDPGTVDYDAHTTVIPVAMSVAAEIPGNAQFGGTVADSNDADNPYNNGVVRGDFDWTWRAESGDWRFFFMDVDNLASSVMSENFNGAFP